MPRGAGRRPTGKDYAWQTTAHLLFHPGASGGDTVVMTSPSGRSNAPLPGRVVPGGAVTDLVEAAELRAAGRGAGLLLNR
jgi:hypothetical protein